MLHKDAYFIPFQIRGRSARTNRAVPGQQDFLAAIGAHDSMATANLSSTARAYLSELGLTDADHDLDTAALIWLHALAMGYTPAYLAENTDRVQMVWPRVPLPADAATLRRSASLGRHLAALLDVSQPVPGVTAGTLRAELAAVAVVQHAESKPLDPAAGDLTVEAGWGYVGQDGAAMPGQGRAVEHPYADAEREAIERGTSVLGITTDHAFDQFGTTTLDLYLNDKALWGNVPARVWRYTVGGFPVLKKWLSYRERSVPRPGPHGRRGPRVPRRGSTDRCAGAPGAQP